MLPDVHLGKGARVSYPDHLHCKIPKEINYLQRLPSQTENQDDGCHHRAQQLLQNKNLEEVGPIKLTPSLGDSKQGIKSVGGRKKMSLYNISLSSYFCILTALYWKSWENWSRVSYLWALPCQWSGM